MSVLDSCSKDNINQDAENRALAQNSMILSLTAGQLIAGYMNGTAPLQNTESNSVRLPGPAGIAAALVYCTTNSRPHRGDALAEASRLVWPVPPELLLLHV